MNQAVFLDRDGTIARDAHYCSRVEDFELFPTVPDAIKLFNDNGFKVVVITNQSGIARGYFDEYRLAQIHSKMQAELLAHGAKVDAIYYCPHHPDDNCTCRKPKTELFIRAAKQLDVDFHQSYVIGDAQSDIDAGNALGCKTVLVTTAPEVEQVVIHSPTFVASNLLEAAKWIVMSRK
jgi:histidinol-phosphate phosphatase family protein